MSTIPAKIDVDRQPPMTIPLRHFLLGLGFLGLGGIAGLANLFDIGSGLVLTAQLHLLFVGWICVTIMGAMTLFVPVWTGTSLHDRRLAHVQLVLVAVGTLGFASSLLTMNFSVGAGFALLMLLGFWTFIYNVARTMLADRQLDRTTRHFWIALGFFLALTTFGVALAIDFQTAYLDAVGIARTSLVLAHLTLAVFGAVVTTIIGAMYQLGTMFTQTSLRAGDRRLAIIEEVCYPSGVVLLAAGRFLDAGGIARIGGVLLVIGLVAFAAVMGRKLLKTRVPWTPMHRRYAVGVSSMLLWGALTLPAWVAAPIDYETRFGGPGGVHLLGAGVIAFVIMGTLYHIIPFIIWVDRYSDRLGYEPVPMVDDLYHAGAAKLEVVLLVVGNGTLVAWELVGVPMPIVVFATFMVGVGTVLFVANMVLVVDRHGRHAWRELVLGLGRPT